MGVAGSGKSTVGPLVADRLGVPFLDGDDFHDAAIIERMRRGRPARRRRPRAVAGPAPRGVWTPTAPPARCWRARRSPWPTAPAWRDGLDVRFVLLDVPPSVLERPAAPARRSLRGRRPPRLAARDPRARTRTSWRSTPTGRRPRSPPPSWRWSRAAPQVGSDGRRATRNERREATAWSWCWWCSPSWRSASPPCSPWSRSGAARSGSPPTASSTATTRRRRRSCRSAACQRFEDTEAVGNFSGLRPATAVLVLTDGSRLPVRSLSDPDAGVGVDALNARVAALRDQH